MNKICVTCRRQMKCLKNGVIVVEMAGADPYQLFRSDLYICTSCQGHLVNPNDHPFMTAMSEEAIAEAMRIIHEHASQPGEIVIPYWVTVQDMQTAYDAGLKLDPLLRPTRQIYEYLDRDGMPVTEPLPKEV